MKKRGHDGGWADFAIMAGEARRLGLNFLCTASHLSVP